MYTIGIDLGGTNIAVGIVDESYKIIKKGSVPTGAERQAICIVDDMAKLCDSLVKDAGLDWTDIESVGIAAPGTANSETGCVEYANNLPFLHFPIAPLLIERIPCKKVYIENDANAAAWGEAVAGAAKGTDSSVFITLGTGVGGGIVINGKVYAGFNFAGAELGHMVIVVDGKPCSCGRKGCWEAYSSATGLIRMTKEKMAECKDTKMWDICEGNADKASGRTAFNAARQGDKAGQEVVDMYIDYLACGLVNILNIYRPQILSIGGGISNERDNLLRPLLERLGESSTQIKIAELGNDAGIIGGALLGKKVS